MAPIQRPTPPTAASPPADNLGAPTTPHDPLVRCLIDGAHPR